MVTISERRRAQWRPRRLLQSVLFYLALLSLMTVILLPIYYIFLTAFAQGDRIFTKPLSYLPQSLSLDRYRTIFHALPIGRYMWNTFFLSTTSTLIALFLSFLAAYAIARIQFPGANVVLIGLLVSALLPGTATVIPLFQMYQRLHLLNTYQGLILLYVTGLLPFTTWVLVSFIRQIPGEIEDAAKVDGAGFVQLIWRVVLPMIQPGIATMFVINFIAGWNEFFIPLIFGRGAGVKVITMALSEAQVIGSSNQFYQSWGNMASVAILITIPVFLITLIFQRQIVDGLTGGVFK